ncbi:MAG: polysaccharide deacetylase family protein [Caldilineaceae bacterium]
MNNRSLTLPVLALMPLLALGVWLLRPKLLNNVQTDNVSITAASNSPTTLSETLSISDSTALQIASQPSVSLHESYCLLPDETVWDVSQRSNVTVEAINALNPKFTGFAGSALHLPPGSVAPDAWSEPMPAYEGMDELPFGVSGYFIGADNRRKRVSLTFDIGYMPENEALMKLLVAHHIKATFFVIGTAMDKRPDVVQALVGYGQELANHSWTHDYMQYMDEAGVLDELRKTEAAVKVAYPEATTKPFFRAPFGAITPEMVQIAKQEGYYTIGWTIDSGDWVPGITPDEIYTRVTNSICPGAIVVMHDANLPSFKALPRILDYLEEQQYEVVPLSTLLFS